MFKTNVPKLNEFDEMLAQLISDFGCLTLKQCTVLCKGDEDAAKRKLSFLILMHLVHERDGLYVPFKGPKVDSITIDSLWVAFDKVKSDTGEYDIDALKTAFPNNPVNVCLVKKDMFYNIVTITEDNIASTMPYLIDRFNKNYTSPEKVTGQEYVFVIRDTGIIKQITSFSPSMPNRIALLEGDVLDIPRIRYLSPKK